VITCEQFMADFGDYFEGEVAVDLRREMESHISHCRTCQVVCDSTSKTVRIVTDSGSFYLRPEAAQPLVAQIMARIRGSLES
jgi:putative zinc finger protein